MSGTLPSKVIVQADYGTSPLWIEVAGTESPIPLERFDLPENLRERLSEWSEVFNSLAATDYEWRDEAALDEWLAWGAQLADELRSAMPNSIQVEFIGLSGLRREPRDKHAEG